RTRRSTESSTSSTKRSTIACGGRLWSNRPVATGAVHRGFDRFGRRLEEAERLWHLPRAVVPTAQLVDTTERRVDRLFASACRRPGCPTRFVLVSTRFKYEDRASDFQSSTRVFSAPTSSIAAMP